LGAVTLAVAIKATDAIVMASDSRGTIGDPRGLTAVNDTQQKVFQFGACGLAIAGAAEMALAILDEFGKAGVKPANVDAGVASFALAATMCEGWYRGIPPGQRPGAMFILGGYRTEEGKPPVPMVYILNSQSSFAPQLANNYPMMAGVPQYAIYLSHRYYDPSISGKNAAALAAYLISETASQDPKVGGPIQIARVTPSKYLQLTTAQIADLQKKNSSLNTKLKKFFAT
jgi:20S proteasome alpha/beta subunit